MDLFIILFDYEVHTQICYKISLIDNVIFIKKDNFYYISLIHLHRQFEELIYIFFKILFFIIKVFYQLIIDLKIFPF